MQIVYGHIGQNKYTVDPRRNLTTGNKLLWIRGEIAPQEQFLRFSTIFQDIFLTEGVKLHVHF